jgi:acyl-CoA synthetase (AMP-forming)/AMP-acid ligase II
MGLHDCSIYNPICRNSQLFGERTALVSREFKITHRQLMDHVNRLAAGLHANGIGKGDRICILARNSPEFVYVYGAAARLGLVLVPVNWRLKPAEISYVISDASPVALFADREFQPVADQIVSDLGLSVLRVSMGPACGSFKGYEDLFDHSWSGPEPDVSEDDAYLMIHTAAVHGKSRGALLTQKNRLITALQAAWRLALTEQDVDLVALPLFHVASPLFMFTVMTAAGTNVILPGFDADAALEGIVRSNVTVFGEFPPMLKLLLDKADEKSVRISSLRHVLGLEQPETIARLQESTRATFWAGYGQTETSYQLP